MLPSMWIPYRSSTATPAGTACHTVPSLFDLWPSCVFRKTGRPAHSPAGDSHAACYIEECLNQSIDRSPFPCTLGSIYSLPDFRSEAKGLNAMLCESEFKLITCIGISAKTYMALTQLGLDCKQPTEINPFISFF